MPICFRYLIGKAETLWIWTRTSGNTWSIMMVITSSGNIRSNTGSVLLSQVRVSPIFFSFSTRKKSLPKEKPQKKHGMDVYACLTHDDLTKKKECCVRRACVCTRECTVVRFCQVAWSGEWVVNFSHLLPVWLPWSSMENRARCFRLPAQHLRTKLDQKSRLAGEFCPAS